jgi:hypothetical protein
MKDTAICKGCHDSDEYLALTFEGYCGGCEQAIVEGTLSP